MTSVLLSVPDGAQEKTLLTRPFRRDQMARMDECAAVHAMIAKARPNGTMIDLGANLGSLARFAASGWTVYAFAPDDPASRGKLLDAYGDKPNVVIPQETVLDDVLARHGISRIDFLKIDAGGSGIATLRGLDFTKVRPEVILARYEDGGTKERDCDLCRLLAERGYTVYVSEWYPIETHENRPSFRRIQRYPCNILQNSWGNLIAFRNEPTMARLKAGFQAGVDWPLFFMDEAEFLMDEPETFESDLPPRSEPRLSRSSSIGTAYILGNGPSLAGFDLTRLKGRESFGMNAAYRHWDTIGWYPTHYACLDEVVGLSHAEAIARLIANTDVYGIRRFLLRRNLIEALGLLARRPQVVEFEALRETDARFAREPLTTGSHTAIWAASLGFSPLVLLGIDAHYVEIVPGAERRAGNMLQIVRDDSNPNYFFEGYQQPGDRYHVPNIGGPVHLRSWLVASGVLAEMGAVTYNASMRSQVSVFEFCDLEQVVQGRPIEPIPVYRVLKQRRQPLSLSVTAQDVDGPS